MKREQLFDTLTELDDQLLEQYFSMDLELARKHARRRLGVRLTAIAACAAIVLGVCLPGGFLVAENTVSLHPGIHLLVADLQKMNKGGQRMNLNLPIV